MKKEMSMEIRLLLAFGLMGLVLLVSQFLLKPPPAPVAKNAKTGQPIQPGAVPAAAVEQPTPPAEAGVKAKPGAAAKGGEAAIAKIARAEGSKEEVFTVDTKVFRVEFSSRGAVARKWIVKAYKDHAGQPLDVVYQPAFGKVTDPFSLAFKERGPSTDPNQALYKTTQSADGLELSFDFSDGHAQFKKAFHFDPASYLVGVTSEVTQDGVPLPHMITWRGGFGDPSVVNPTAVQHALYYDLTNTKLQVKTAKDAKDAAINANGQFSFVGLEDSYFTAAFLPSGKTSVDQTTYADDVPDGKGKEEKRVGMGVGGSGTNELRLFVGPKDTDLLRKVDPKLEQVVDWGFFGVIAKPLFLVLNWTADHVSHNYGWAIVLVTIAINVLLFPLKISSMKSSKKMQALQPQIKAINDKYKNLPMRDPKQSEKQQETMDLYKKNDVNIAGGCLPMLVQLPFLYAFYKVLAVAIEMRGAHWFWVSDLSQPETLAIHLLPILLVATQFLTQKMTPATPGMDPTQQKMMMFMPLMFGYMFYFASAGLVLYWLTGNVVGIAQQLVLNRSMPTPKVTPPPKGSGKKGKG